MKKSEIYHKAALAVMNDKLQSYTFDERLAAVKQLLNDEELALFIEEAEKGAAE